ncbi:ABC transporter ATP-binding protein [Candidatus Geothermarchaeota archaeon]|nr:MAG: ABC transporter ATP-binding protein [Candidatus Geothermarchaeota archaeon]
MRLLEIKDLKVYYFVRDGVIKAIDGIRLWMDKGESLGVVGESGSGKSTLAAAIMRLIPPPGKIVEGSILFKGVDLTKLKEEDMRKIRGKSISMVFQDPMTSLDPLQTIGDHLTETILAHEKIDRRKAIEMALELLDKVGIPKDRFKDYPHQFSGGMRQRVMIALAMALKPDLIIADEPTTALDVIIQAQILDLLRELKDELNMSLILISHDLSVVSEIADRIAVMYAGHVMEFSDAMPLFDDPLHPYTQGLMRSVPNIELSDQELRFIPGNPPDMLNPPSGCRFHPRCPRAMEICRIKEPPLVEVEKGRFVKCFLYGNDA